MLVKLMDRDIMLEGQATWPRRPSGGSLQLTCHEVARHSQTANQ